MNTKNIVITITIIAVALIGFGLGSQYNNQNQISKDSESAVSEDKKAIVYKSPTCGCCGNYITYLRSNGFDVEIKSVQNTASVKEEHGIPYNMSSCHTTVIGDYFIEGHVPIEAVDKLLTEKPDIDGIALPGMPAGSPGMPGLKSGEFIIHSLSDGKVSEFMSL
jgi:hypothetical protein